MCAFVRWLCARANSVYYHSSSADVVSRPCIWLLYEFLYFLPLCVFISSSRQNISNKM